VLASFPLALLGLEGLWGMIGVEKIGEIRRAYFEQHHSIKEIVRTLSVSRATVPRLRRWSAPDARARDLAQPGRLRPRRARFILLNPDANQLTRDIMPLGKRVQALPGNELSRDLPLELNAVGTLSGHGFHPLKAQLTLSNH
jgi:hypothetical protein